MSQEDLKAAFITFYSFKGGVGRSMALINTAGMLAGRGFRVLVIDLDLEAPGLSYLDPDEPGSPATANYSPQAGFVDLLSDAKDRGEEADLFVLSPETLLERYARPYRLPNEIGEVKDGALLIMPAGKLDSDYPSRFDSLNLRQLYEEKVGEPLIRAFKKKFAEAGLFDYVLIDSRTGFSDEAGICTRDLADHLIVLSGLNRQNIEGTAAFLRAFRLSTGGKRPGLQIILSPVPIGEDALVDDRESVAANAFGSAWGSKVDLSLEIPYHPQLALTEAPHIFRRRRGYLFDAYSAIEDSMLKAIGHDAPTLKGGIEIGLGKGDYARVFHDLKSLLRVNGGELATSQLAVRLAMNKRRSRKGKENTEISGDNFTLDAMLNDDCGRAIVELLIDHVSIVEGEWEARALLQELTRIRALDLAGRLFDRLVKAAPTNAGLLGDYAVFLETQIEDKEGAEMYYKRSIEVDPNNATVLCFYADFLEMRCGDMDRAELYYKRAADANHKNGYALFSYVDFLTRHRRDSEGESYYKRAIEEDPDNAYLLGGYADFLQGRRRGNESEPYYKRAIEKEPKNANILSSYAVLLETHRGDMENAEVFYKRAIEADPKSFSALGNYASFLDKVRGDKASAEAYYKKAIRADSRQANLLGNYGQFLVSEGRFVEGNETLSSAFKLLKRTELRDAAEICFSLYLVAMIQGHDADRWERAFKFFIQQDFEWPGWSFEGMLDQARRLISSEEFEYARSLASAFLDAGKVAELDRFERWRALEAVRP